MSKKSGVLKNGGAADAEGVPTGETAAPHKRGTGTARRRGRPPGKRSDPDFEQVTVYIRRRTHQDAKIALIKGDDRQEFSELVEDLVAKWLKK